MRGEAVEPVGPQRAVRAAGSHVVDQEELGLAGEERRERDLPAIAPGERVVGHRQRRKLPAQLRELALLLRDALLELGDALLDARLRFGGSWLGHGGLLSGLATGDGETMLGTDAYR